MTFYPNSCPKAQLSQDFTFCVHFVYMCFSVGKKDEKLLEVSLEAVASRVQELKESIQSFLAKLEHEQLTW